MNLGEWMMSYNSSKTSTYSSRHSSKKQNDYQNSLQCLICVSAISSITPRLCPWADLSCSITHERRVDDKLLPRLRLIIHSPLTGDLVHNPTWIRGYGWSVVCMDGENTWKVLEVLSTWMSDRLWCMARAPSYTWTQREHQRHPTLQPHLPSCSSHFVTKLISPCLDNSGWFIGELLREVRHPVQKCLLLSYGSGLLARINWCCVPEAPSGNFSSLCVCWIGVGIDVEGFLWRC